MTCSACRQFGGSRKTRKATRKARSLKGGVSTRSLKGGVSTRSLKGGVSTRSLKGGASAAPLSYLNPKYVEPSGPEGVNRLISEPLLARPSLNHTGGKRRTKRSKKRTSKKTRRGGFYPSVMGSFLSNGARLLPATAVQGYRMLRNYKKSRKTNM
jgi:hypothetical protein